VATLAKGVMNAMLISKLKIPLGLFLALGLVTLGWGAFHGTRAADDAPPTKQIAKAPAPDAPTQDDSADEDTDLPVGTPLAQVRVRLDKNGKLVVKTVVRSGWDITAVMQNNPPPEVINIQIQRYDLADVKVVNTRGKTIEETDLARMLKKETVAMASLHGEPVDPLHLRVLKEGTLVFALPAAKPTNGSKPINFPQRVNDSGVLPQEK
jgi:hypothetical protein